MNPVAESIGRIREELRGGTRGLLVGQCRVLRKDLKALLEEFERVEKLVDGEFANLGDAASTKLIASPGVPEGYVVAADHTGRVAYAGPITELPPFDETISRLVMNVHPETLRLIEGATKARPHG